MVAVGGRVIVRVALAVTLEREAVAVVVDDEVIVMCVTLWLPVVVRVAVIVFEPLRVGEYVRRLLLRLPVAVGVGGGDTVRDPLAVIERVTVALAVRVRVGGFDKLRLTEWVHVGIDGDRVCERVAVGLGSTKLQRTESAAQLVAHLEPSHVADVPSTGDCQRHARRHPAPLMVY